MEYKKTTINFNNTNFNNSLLSIKKFNIEEKLEQEKEGKEGFIALGYKDDFNYIYSLFKQSIYILSSKDFTKNNFFNIFGVNFVLDNYTDIKTVNKMTVEFLNIQKLTQDIIIKCQEKGIYNIENQNGYGIFKINEDELLINSKELLKFNIKTKKITKLNNRIIENNVFLNIKDLNLNEKDFINNDYKLKDEELKDLYNFINTWKFSRKNDDKIYLGWLISSVLSGASDWRSHASLTGAAGSGKSSLIKNSCLLFRELIEDFDGNSTEAGIRQKIGSSACAVLVDESEADNDKLKNRLEFFRTASSGGKIAKGSQDQKGLNFKIQVSGLIAGIVEPIFENSADASRFLMIKLLEKKAIIEEDAHYLFNNKLELQKIGKKIILKMLNNFDLYIKNLYIFKTLLTKKYNVSRFADTVCPSLSAFYTLFFNNSDEEKIKMFLNEFDFTNEEEQNNTKDHTNAIDYLYNYLFKFENYKFNFNTIIASNLFKNESIKNELGNFGIKVKENNLNYLIYIDTKNNNFQQIFKDTKFSKGNLTSLLSRNENIKVISDSVMINNVRSKRNAVILIDIKKDYFKENDFEIINQNLLINNEKEKKEDNKELNFDDLKKFKNIVKNYNLNNSNINNNITKIEKEIKQQYNNYLKEIKKENINNFDDEDIPLFDAEIENFKKLGMTEEEINKIK